jgi:hypothetical protein
MCTISMLTSIKNRQKSNNTLHYVQAKQGHQIHEKQKPLEKEWVVTTEEIEKQTNTIESQNKQEHKVWIWWRK